MRDDLQDALVPVKWADAQIPILERRFRLWSDGNPYRFVAEMDPDAADMELVVAYLDKPIHPVIVGDVGAIINSLRSALNLMFSAVIARHNVVAGRTDDFPIITKGAAADFFGTVKGLKNKYTFTGAEIAAVERTKAYPGGDHVLSHIAILDNMRKHQRLLRVVPLASEVTMDFGMIPLLHGLNDKTIVGRVRRGRMASPTKGQIKITPEIFLNEPPAGVGDKPAMLALRVYKERVDSLIRDFP